MPLISDTGVRTRLLNNSTRRHWQRSTTGTSDDVDDGRRDGRGAGVGARALTLLQWVPRPRAVTAHAAAVPRGAARPLRPLSSRDPNGDQLGLDRGRGRRRHRASARRASEPVAALRGGDLAPTPASTRAPAGGRRHAREVAAGDVGEQAAHGVAVGASGGRGRTSGIARTPWRRRWTHLSSSSARAPGRSWPGRGRSRQVDRRSRRRADGRATSPSARASRARSARRRWNVGRGRARSTTGSIHGVILTTTGSGAASDVGMGRVSRVSIGHLRDRCGAGRCHGRSRPPGHAPRAETEGRLRRCRRRRRGGRGERDGVPGPVVQHPDGLIELSILRLGRA